MLLNFEIFSILGIITVFLCSKLKNKLVLSISLLVLLVTLINIYYPHQLNSHIQKAAVSQQPNMTLEQLTPKITEGYFVLSNISAESFIYSALILLLVFSLKNTNRLLLIIVSVTLVDCLIVIAQRLMGNLGWGFMMTSTMDATLIAIMYPLMLGLSNDLKGVLKWSLRILPVIAIFATTSSIGIGGLVLAMALVFEKKKYLLIPAAIFVVALITNPLLMSDSLRFVCWEWSMKWWWSNASLLFGTGPGTYYSLGPYIQQLVHGPTKNGLYAFMHSDWIQCLFEMGVVGFSLVSVLFYKCLRIARDRPYLFASIVVYGATAVFNMPTKYPITAILGVLLVRIAMECEGDNL